MPAAGCPWPWMVPEAYEDAENESDDDATADISRPGWPYAWPPWCPLSLGGQDMAIMMPPPLSRRLPVEATARDLEVAYSKRLRHAVQQYVSHRMCLDNLQASISGSRSRPSPHSAYMNLSITCEMCRKRTRETASLLVCDSCELAFHVHCLEKFKATGLADGEHDWICPKCIVRHAGCPQPRLYGRVPSDRTRQENHTQPSPIFLDRAPLRGRGI